MFTLSACRQLKEKNLSIPAAAGSFSLDASFGLMATASASAPALFLGSALCCGGVSCMIYRIKIKTKFLLQSISIFTLTLAFTTKLFYCKDCVLESVIFCANSWAPHFPPLSPTRLRDKLFPPDTSFLQYTPYYIDNGNIL